MNITKTLELLPAVEQEIRKKYNVLDIINLFDWQSNPHELKKYLLNIKKDSSRNYNFNDRIVFLYFDTDFYLDLGLCYPGFQICNLQSILSELNIPNSFVLLLTNHLNIEPELKKAQKLYSTDLNSINYIVTELSYLHYDPTKVKDIALNRELVTKEFSCLNGAVRLHRVKLFQLIQNYHFLHKGLISYRQERKFNNNDQLNIDQNNLETPYLITHPFSAINDCWDTRKIDLLLKNKEWLPTTQKLDGKVNDIDTRYQFLELQKSFLYVATETVCNYPHPYLSEKSYKGITAKRPFIIIGARHSLLNLKRLGYKTFSDYWDESYDRIDDPAERLIAAFDQIKNICQKPLLELQHMLFDMNSILEFNFNHYKESFNIQFDKLIRDIDLELDIMLRDSSK